MIQVVAVAPPVAVSVTVASRWTVVPGAGVAVVAVGVLSGRGSKTPGVAGARVVAARRVAVSGRVALLPGAQVGVTARGRRLPAQRAGIAVSPPRGRGPPVYSTVSAAGRARRRGPLRGRAGPARRWRPALHRQRGPGGPQVEVARVAAVVGRPAPGLGAPWAAAAVPEQAPRAAMGRRRAPPAALERRLGGLGHLYGLTIQGLAVHVSGGGFGICRAFEGDEREAPGLVGFSIFHQEHLGEAAILAKRGLEDFLVGFEVEPANEELPRAIHFHHVCGSGGVGCGSGGVGGEVEAPVFASEPAGRGRLLPVGRCVVAETPGTTSRLRRRNAPVCASRV